MKVYRGVVAGIRQAGSEWIVHSTQASQVGELVGMSIGPDDIHIMRAQKEGAL